MQKGALGGAPAEQTSFKRRNDADLREGRRHVRMCARVFVSAIVVQRKQQPRAGKKSLKTDFLHSGGDRTNEQWNRKSRTQIQFGAGGKLTRSQQRREEKGDGGSSVGERGFCRQADRSEKVML